jgi:hypothetical protein
MRFLRDKISDLTGASLTWAERVSSMPKEGKEKS